MVSVLVYSIIGTIVFLSALDRRTIDDHHPRSNDTYRPGPPTGGNSVSSM
jgi:hypothetical protein